MKAIGEWMLAVVVGLVVLAAIAPALIDLSGAVLPVLIVAALAVIAVRLVFFHTRRW
ncbi:MAG: hypothetical protein AB7V58_06380 [Solirubrobacterales bacterium]